MGKKVIIAQNTPVKKTFKVVFMGVFSHDISAKHYRQSEAG